MRRWVPLGTAGLLTGVLVSSALVGCGVWGVEGGPGAAGAARPAVTTQPPAVDATMGSDGVQHIDVTAGDDLRFNPSVVRAKPGVIVFTFHNGGLTPHDVRIEVPTPGASDGTVSGNINGGDTTTVRVTVDTPGTYPFPCVYHASSGMVGTLIVSQR